MTQSPSVRLVTEAALSTAIASTTPNELWSPSNVLAVPDALPACGSGNTGSMTSGTAYLLGGPGMVIPAGRTANYITFQSNNAAVTPTHQWFFLAVPDQDGGTVFVVATSVDDGTTPWGTNAAKQLSLKTADGGSGGFTPTVDTPVYAGIVQVATTTAYIRGPAGNAFVDLLLSGRMWWGSGPAGLTVPSSLAGDFTLTQGSVVPLACMVSES